MKMSKGIYVMKGGLITFNRKSLTINRKLKKITRKRILSEKMDSKAFSHQLFNNDSKDKVNMIRFH